MITSASHASLILFSPKQAWRAQSGLRKPNRNCRWSRVFSSYTHLLQPWIDADRLGGVERALRGASVGNIHSAASLVGGYSASRLLKLDAAAASYVLRVMSYEQDVSGRQQHIDCMQLASAHHIAPKCFYSSAADGIMLMEYVPAQPAPVQTDHFAALATSLQTLHQIRGFPAAAIDLETYMAGLIASYAERAPPAYVLEHLRQVQALHVQLGVDRADAFCHNDLNPNNLLFVQNRCILVDWEGAGGADPYFDLASVCNVVANAPEHEVAFLQAYFGGEPPSAATARLRIMRQISLIFYALHFLLYSIAEAPPPGLPADIDIYPDLRTWQGEARDGRRGLQIPEELRCYAMALLKTSMRTMR